MKRWIVALVLSALLAMSSGVYAAAPAADLKEANSERALEHVPENVQDKLPAGEDDDAEVMTTQGAIWPKGIW